jgi:hypothetical protein
MTSVHCKQRAGASATYNSSILVFHVPRRQSSSQAVVHLVLGSTQLGSLLAPVAISSEHVALHARCTPAPQWGAYVLFSRPFKEPHKSFPHVVMPSPLLKFKKGLTFPSRW